MNAVSVYQRAGRTTWYVQYWCGKRQRRVNESSGFRLDDPQGKRKARNYALEHAAAGAIIRATAPHERWDAWVAAWIVDAYRARPRTQQRYLGAWSFLGAFLAEARIPIPRLLSYAHVLSFIEWRTSQAKASGRTPSRNTALLDVRVLSQVMREAMRRGFASSNPADRIGISKDAAREKPELTDAEIATIRADLARPETPAWMRASFEIALHQGCRLRETSVDLRDVDVDRDTITFRAKGGKVFATRLHPGLRPLMVSLKQARAPRTCDIPRMASLQWRRLFDRLRLPHLCFHCLRVTCVTRMARAGVPVQQTMAYVGHASEIVHRVYQRLRAPDLTACVNALQFAPPPESKPAPP